MGGGGGQGHRAWEQKKELTTLGSTLLPARLDQGSQSASLNLAPVPTPPRKPLWHPIPASPPRPAEVPAPPVPTALGRVVPAGVHPAVLRPWSPDAGASNPPPAPSPPPPSPRPRPPRSPQLSHSRVPRPRPPTIPNLPPSSSSRPGPARRVQNPCRCLGPGDQPHPRPRPRVPAPLTP